MTDPYVYKRRIVCAANVTTDGHLALGARHHDMTMNAHIGLYRFAGYTEDDYSFREQGFIDQHGVFLTREEAWIVANEAGQIIRRVGGDMSPDSVGKLFSENLY